eukprot:scaffold2830_cov131-Cylindrotheca_fusiformis.AAC.76
MVDNDRATTSHIRDNFRSNEFSIVSRMERWFQQATSEECDAMLSLQLDYRFAGDVFTTMWWTLFQRMGFKHTGLRYELPASFPSEKRKEYGANDMYKLLDSFAIPQLVSSYQKEETKSETIASMTPEEARWWKRIRRELIFHKFHTDIEARAVKRRPGNSGRSRKRIPTHKSKSAGKYSKKNGFATDAGAELYIRKTSKHAKHARANKKFDQEHEIVFPSIEEYATAALDYQKDDLRALEESYYPTFGEWRFLTATNQSLLFYGVGSKQSLLNKFVEMELKPDGDVLVINGFDKAVAIELILDLIVHKWLNGRDVLVDAYETHLIRDQGSTLTNGISFPRHGDPLLVQRAIAIGRELSHQVLTTLRPLYVVIHSIDGIGLRNHTAQEALAALIYHSRTAVLGQNAIRLVASIDHVNGPLLMWDSTLNASFQWSWKRVSTYRPYIDEVMDSKLPDGQKVTNRKRGTATTTEQRHQKTKQSTFDVLASLAPRLTQSLHQLVRLQVEQKLEWVEYSALKKKCQLNFTVSSDNQLRVFLRELMDHGIVVSDNGNPRYRVPYGTAGLKQILNFKKSS